MIVLAPLNETSLAAQESRQAIRDRAGREPGAHETTMQSLRQPEGARGEQRALLIEGFAHRDALGFQRADAPLQNGVVSGGPVEVGAEVAGQILRRGELVAHGGEAGLRGLELRLQRTFRLSRVAGGGLKCEDALLRLAVRKL